MQVLHTPEPWYSQPSTEDYQGHFIVGNGRTVAATITENDCRVTAEDHANAQLLVTAPILLRSLRQIAITANFGEEELSMELGQRLITIEQVALATLAAYENEQASIEKAADTEVTASQDAVEADVTAIVPLTSLMASSGTHRIDNHILRCCSAGPWQHGLQVLPFSADSQPCVFGNERELPLALLEPDDVEAESNVVLMAAGWELCQQLGLLLDAVTQTVGVLDSNAKKLQSQCQNAADLLARIHRDIRCTTAERYGKECDGDD